MDSSRLNSPAELQLAAIARPSGRVLLAGQILPRKVFSGLPGDVRIWIRWAAPEQTGLESAVLEFAVATRRDEAARTAHVVARATEQSRDCLERLPAARIPGIDGFDGSRTSRTGRILQRVGVPTGVC